MVDDVLYASTLYDGKARTLYKLVCSICNVNYYVPANQCQKRKTCSIKCRGLLDTKNNSIVLQCSYCHKQHKKRNSQLKNSKHGIYFCTRTCKETAQAIATPGFKPLKLPHYDKGKFVEYRKVAFKKLGKICCKCGYNKTSRMLDVHHIDQNRDNNLINNLVVLCVWCHALVTRRVSLHTWTGIV